MVRSSALSINREEAAYANGTVTNGFGNVSKVCAEVQKGTSAVLQIDFTIKTVSLEAFQSWKTSAMKNFSSEQQHMLNEEWGGGGVMGGFLCGCFGMLFGGGNAHHYKNQSERFNTASNEKTEGFTKSVYNLTEQKFHVTGTLTATGTSFIPVRACAFVELTKIQFSDGKTITVINQDQAMAAGQSGETTASGSGKMNIVPL
jgi:hypothetical protein